MPTSALARDRPRTAPPDRGWREPRSRPTRCRAPSRARAPLRGTLRRTLDLPPARPSRRGMRASSPRSGCRQAVGVVRGSPQTAASLLRDHLHRASCRRERGAPLQSSSRPQPLARRRDSLRPTIVPASKRPAQQRSSRDRRARRPGPVRHRSREIAPRSPRVAVGRDRSRLRRVRPFHTPYKAFARIDGAAASFKASACSSQRRVSAR